MHKDTQREIDGENLQREYEAHLGMLAMLEDMGMSKDKLNALTEQWRKQSGLLNQEQATNPKPKQQQQQKRKTKKMNHPEFFVHLPDNHSKASELGYSNGGYFTHTVCEGFSCWDWTHRHSFPRWKKRATAEKHLRTAHAAGFVDAYIVDNSCD